MRQTKKTELLETVISSVKAIGEEETINALKKAQNKLTEYPENDVFEIIIRNTLKVYKISRDELYSGNSRSDRLYAIGASCMMIQKHLKWSLQKMSQHFNGYLPQSLFNHIKRNENLDRKIPLHSQMIDKLLQLEEYVEKELNPQI